MLTLKYTGDVKKMASKHLHVELKCQGHPVLVWQRQLLLTAYLWACLCFDHFAFGRGSCDALANGLYPFGLKHRRGNLKFLISPAAVATSSVPDRRALFSPGSCVSYVKLSHHFSAKLCWSCRMRVK